MTPARACGYRVVRRVFERGAYADRALHAESRGLHDPRERALAMTLAYGTVQRRRTLDHLLARLSARNVEELDPPVLAALRLGLFQLAFLDGIAEHAAVHESVELAKGEAPYAASLVNAVLRRAAREREVLLSDLTDDTPENAGVMYSVPDWLAALWFEELGPAEARALLQHVNRPAESSLRVNTLKADPDTLVLPVESHGDPDLPEARVLDAPFDVFGSSLWREGLVMPQSRASIRVSRSLAPHASERVLDLCAAPGAKTTHLAALGEDRADVVAVEAHPGRARELQETCRRMGAGQTRVVNADGRQLPPDLGEFDRILVDAPCSGLGTLQSRPDLRWQPRRGQLEDLVAKQSALLGTAASRLATGGTLVYSVCTISRRESEQVLERLLGAHDELELLHSEQLLPHRDGTDGFYIATIRRRKPALR